MCRISDKSPRGDSGRSFDDSGMTLVELMIASAIFLVLLTSVFITTDLINSVSGTVLGQYQEFNQSIPALAPLQKLLRAEVEPAPAPSNAPATPGFSAIGNYSLTFYSNIGTAYNNITSAGTTAGPAEIVAEEIAQNGSPVTATTSCTTASPCSFQVWKYLPVTNGGTSTCPVTGQPSSNVCQYSGGTEINNVLDVVNSPSLSQPIFSYTIYDPNTNGGTAITPTATEIQNQQLTGLSPPYPTGGATQTLSSGGVPTCNAPNSNYPTVAIACPLDAIQSVGIDLMVSVKGSGNNGQGQVENQTIVYRYPLSAGASAYPYQYTSAVG